MKSTQSNQFNQTPRADIPRSSFDLSHGLKTTLDAGYLVPILSLEVLPGDTINCRAALFGRLATPLKPILDNLHLETFFFFTPYRQVWDNWTKFHGEQIDPGDSTDFLVPEVVAPTDGFGPGTLYDYMGIPTGVEGIKFSALPFRIYNHIYNNWFRDQNIIDSRTVRKAEGPDPSGNYQILRRRKRRDYLTSVLPWPQKGTEVSVPLAGFADVLSDLDHGGTGQIQTTHGLLLSAGTAGTGNASFGTPLPTAGAVTWTSSGLVADLGSTNAISINDLRESF